MENLTSNKITEIIIQQIQSQQEKIKNKYKNSKQQIGYFYIDNVLPEDLAKKCFEVFPDKSEMKRLKSIREYKYVSAQMNKHNTLLEDVLYAFQDKRIVNLIAEICGLNQVYADESLYAGGLSLMGQSNFLNPHLDNSHDAERHRWRVLNLLYYVTPDWESNNGGHLELWPNGPKKRSYSYRK